MENIIEVKNLAQHYGKRKIFENLNFSVQKGKIVGLLGKNGVGKSTTINILMGYLKPYCGECIVYGENSSKLSPQTKKRIGLLHEGHVTYDFFTIEKLEKYFAAWYGGRWKSKNYYELIEKLGVPYSQKVRNLSCGQRSQVVLGLIFAQDPELLILDDYSMGLDVGYRRLFVEYLKDFAARGDKTVLMTTHIVSELKDVLDEILIMTADKPLLHTSVKEFTQNFKKYELQTNKPVKKTGVIINTEEILKKTYVFSFAGKSQTQAELARQEINAVSKEIPMDFEDAFLGFTGRYESVAQ